MLAMIQRIKIRGTADLEREPWLWQLEKLNDMHMLNKQNIEYILKQTGIAKELLDQIIKNEGLKVYQNTSEQLAEELGTTPPHNDVKQVLESYAQQTFLDVNNFVNQTLLTTSLGDNSVMRIYQKIVEESVAKVVSGVTTKDQAINDTVMKWIDKGIPSAFVDKGGHLWNIDTYARTVVQSTTYRVYNDMRTRASEELGVDTFYYSMHQASRPACAPIQGKVVTKAEQGFYSEELGYYVSSLYEHGWGDPAGALGINCHHYLTPFVVGVNEVPDVPESMKGLSYDQIIENGKQQARQRAYERSIKDDKYKLKAAQELGDDKRIQHYKNMLSVHNIGLNQLIKANPFLYRDTAREKLFKDGTVEEYIKQFKNN